MKTLAVIPARGGSKSIPRKNVVDVAGRPLIAWVIEAARGAKRVDRLIVSTEDEEIADTARRFGAEVPFVRPPELATDTVSLIPVVQHALAAMDGLGFRADAVMSLQPTSPGLRAADIDAAVAKLEDSGADSVATVLRVEHEHPYWAKRLEGDRVRPFSAETDESYLQRQDLPPAYVFDGAIFVRRRRLLEEWSGRDFCLGADVRGLPLSAESSLHIDDEIHLEVARALLARRASRAES
jgi:CMP-N,N'-diacetyllegionaminic acid synthase